MVKLTGFVVILFPETLQRLKVYSFMVRFKLTVSPARYVAGQTCVPRSALSTLDWWYNVMVRAGTASHTAFKMRSSGGSWKDMQELVESALEGREPWTAAHSLKV